MNLQEFIINNRDYYSIETFILSLLRIHIEDQGRPFKIIKRTLVGDAIAEKGFDSFQGATLFEVKPTLRRSTLQDIFRNFHKASSIINSEFRISDLIIISTLQDRNLQFAANDDLLLAKELSGVKITIWGPDDINKIINKHRKEANDIVNNLFSKRLENAINIESKDWKTERDERLLELKELYLKGQFSMFLGAGVSSSAGMADWDTLLNSLFVTYLSKEFEEDNKIGEIDIKEIVARLNVVDDKSALRAARYLRSALIKKPKSDSSFINAITENLYQLRDTSKNIDSTLIQSISNLCMPTRIGARVKSVITYNFDDLLERNLSVKKIKHHSVYMDNDFCDPEELPLYHVHGFLPEDRAKYANLEKSTLVFSEEGYHNIYTDAYHWSNLVQLSNLRDNNCMMIGLSMADPNLRRLLDISAKNLDKPRHFAFIRRLSEKRFCYEKVKDGKEEQVIQNVEAAKTFLDIHHKLNEDLMRELGVTVIWYEGHDDIPPLLDKLHE
ncbi:SIR2 family protein [Chryseobacterium sp.]|uniref:SIR2 family protein n=1 Tax=Chryseobacterium sp. TaxID=1871047 RepID=UPI0031D9CDE9